MGRKVATLPRLSRYRGQPHCHSCDIVHLLQNALDTPHLPAELMTSIINRGPYMPGDRIYRSGSPFKTIQAVSSGSVKTELTRASGHLQVTGFYLKGDLFGAEALGGTHHINDAIAIEETWICELPLDVFMQLCREQESMLESVFRLLATRTRASQLHQICYQGNSNAERVMGFLTDFAEQSQTRLNHCDELTRLPMNKEDIASYLAITPESLSRILKRLEQAGDIQNHTHAFALLN